MVDEATLIVPPETAGPQETARWLVENQGAQDTTEWQSVSDRYTALQATPVVAPSDPMADMGFFESIGEAFTGTARETESTRTLPSYSLMPELNELTNADAWQSNIAFGGLMQGTPEEMAQIITAQFPDTEVRQDEKGNYIFKSSRDGKEYVIRPGFGEGDTTRFAGQSLMMAPAAIVGGAALATGAPALAVAGLAGIGYGLTSAGYQLYQKSIGGEFNGFDVAMDAFAPAGFDSAIIGLKAAANTVGPAIKNTWSNLLSRFRPPEELATLNQRTNDEVQQLFNRAKDGDIPAQQELAALGQTDLDTIAAAEALGIADYLQPDHVSTDTQFIELMQLIKSWKGSTARKEEIANLTQLSEKLVDEMRIAGAQTTGDMSAVVYSQLDDTIDTLGRQADGYWDNFRKAVGIEGQSDVPPAFFNPETALNQINAKLARNNDNKSLLSKYERDFLRLFSPREIKNAAGEVTTIQYPTIDMFETFRRSLTNGMAKKPTGNYMNESAGELKKFYNIVLEEERKAVQQNFGPEVLADFDLARQTSALRFGAIDDQLSIFGKGVSESLAGKLGQGLKKMRAGDAAEFVKFMDAIPEDERSNVLATGLKMMLPLNAKGGLLNFSSFADWYGSILAQKPAHDVLKKYLPAEALQMFDNVYKVSKGIDQALRQRVFTGATMQLTDLLTAESVMGHVMQLAKDAGKLGAAEAVTSTVVGLPGAAISVALVRSLGRGTPTNTLREQALKAADDLLMSPAFMNMVRGQYSDESIRRFALSSGWQNFARKIGVPPDFGTDLVRSARAAVISELEFNVPEPLAEELVAPNAPPPQASVARPIPAAPPTRGVPGLNEPASGAPATPVEAPPAAVAQGPSSREMFQQLFPFG